MWSCPAFTNQSSYCKIGDLERRDKHLDRMDQTKDLLKHLRLNSCCKGCELPLTKLGYRMIGRSSSVGHDSIHVVPSYNISGGEISSCNASEFTLPFVFFLYFYGDQGIKGTPEGSVIMGSDVL